jgi:ribosomal protein S18 acetylase RimI-like enzyme
VVDDGGRLAGAVLLMSRPSPEGVLAGLYVAGSPRVTTDLVRWALQLSRAAGATVTQTFVTRGRGGFLHDAGMRVARPWWRMDRGLLGELPRPAPVPGYELLDATRAPAHAWAALFNRSFADHWRFTPRVEEEIVDGRPPELCLMAVTSLARSPAAIAFGEVEAYREDQRPQPVGLVSSVGTLPEHRRRGLAGWLVAEVMERLRRAGARSASLYVDGMNTTRAFDLYRRLGFEVAFEADVWEATFP